VKSYNLERNRNILEAFSFQRVRSITFT